MPACPAPVRDVPTPTPCASPQRCASALAASYRWSAAKAETSLLEAVAHDERHHHIAGNQCPAGIQTRRTSSRAIILTFAGVTARSESDAAFHRETPTSVGWRILSQELTQTRMTIVAFRLYGSPL